MHRPSIPRTSPKLEQRRDGDIVVIRNGDGRAQTPPHEQIAVANTIEADDHADRRACSSPRMTASSPTPVLVLVVLVLGLRG